MKPRVGGDSAQEGIEETTAYPRAALLGCDEEVGQVDFDRVTSILQDANHLPGFLEQEMMVRVTICATYIRPVVVESPREAMEFRERADRARMRTDRLIT
jgi:hypothetical protein